MTNREYYRTKEIAAAGYAYYPNWELSFEEWLDVEHVVQMPSLYGNNGYPYYTATYEQALRYSRSLSSDRMM